MSTQDVFNLFLSYYDKFDEFIGHYNTGIKYYNNHRRCYCFVHNAFTPWGVGSGGTAHATVGSLSGSGSLSVTNREIIELERQRLNNISFVNWVNSIATNTALIANNKIIQALRGTGNGNGQTAYELLVLIYYKNEIVNNMEIIPDAYNKTGTLDACFTFNASPEVVALLRNEIVLFHHTAERVIQNFCINTIKNRNNQFRNTHASPA